MMLATNRVERAHESQGIVEAETHARIFEEKGIAALIEQIAEAHAVDVLPFSGDMQSSKVQARKWAVEALIDYVAALADYEVCLISLDL
jgi:hypothetical protein